MKINDFCVRCGCAKCVEDDHEPKLCEECLERLLDENENYL